MSFFCFYESFRVLKSGPYIRIDNAIFLTDFFWGCPPARLPIIRCTGTREPRTTGLP